MPANRAANAPIPEVADAVQEFLTDWIIRRNYQEAASLLRAGHPSLRGGFDGDESHDIAGAPAAGEPGVAGEGRRRVGTANQSQPGHESGSSRGRPRCASSKHAFEQDFTIVEAPTELGEMYECGATPPKKFVPSSTPQYGTYYGAVLQVVREGRPGGTLVLVWRRVNGEWRLVAYRAVE